MTRTQIVLMSLLVAFAISPGPSATSHRAAPAVDQVKVDLKLVKVLPDKLELEVLVENSGEQAVYVMTDPVKQGGVKSPYISTADGDLETIYVSVRLFPHPEYCIYSDSSSMKLQRLDAGSTLKQVFQMPYLVSETRPPWPAEFDLPKKFDLTRGQLIRASVGVLPDDEGIRDLLERKAFGPFIRSGDVLMKGPFEGKSLLDLQRVYTSPGVRYHHSDEISAAVNQITVDLKLLKATPDRLETEVVVTNTSDQDVFVMTDPVRVDGSKGPYISIADENTLDIAVRVFPLPLYFVDPNAAHVKLEKLAAGAAIKQVFHLTSLVSETMPPYGDHPTRRKIDPDRFHFLRASVGVLPDDEGVKDLLRRKRFGPFVNGVEELMQGAFKSKRIMDLQRVYTSARVPTR